MNVFISWSGPLSNKLANAIKDWLGQIFLREVEIFISSAITKGKVWDVEIFDNLKNSQIGILCLTHDNLRSEWLHFEAGALAVKVDQNKVMPILFDIKNSDLVFPLARFQTTQFNKPEMEQFVSSINAEFGNSRIKDENLKSQFERVWPEIEKLVKEIFEADNNNTPVKHRSQEEIIIETLDLIRKMSNQLDGKYEQSYSLKVALKKHLGKTYQFHHAAIRLDDEKVYIYLLGLYNFYLSILDDLNEVNKDSIESSLVKLKNEIITFLQDKVGGKYDDILDL